MDTNEVSNQLISVISSCDVKIVLKLEIIKPLDAKLTDELYTRLQKDFLLQKVLYNLLWLEEIPKESFLSSIYFLFCNNIKTEEA